MEAIIHKAHIEVDRKGTKAAVMQGQIDGKIKEERSQKLIELSKQNEERHNTKQIGKELAVLWEEKENNFIKGHTSNYMVVKAPYKPIEGEITTVKITGQDNLELLGEY